MDSPSPPSAPQQKEKKKTNVWSALTPADSLNYIPSYPELNLMNHDLYQCWKRSLIRQQADFSQSWSAAIDNRPIYKKSKITDLFVEYQNLLLRDSKRLVLVSMFNSVFSSLFSADKLKKMSNSGSNQSNLLGVDDLQIIFQNLEGADLVNCEAVCRQWRDILLGGTPWRRLFHRNKEKLPLWRRTQKKLVSNKLTLRTEQYRDVCRKILLVYQNWRMGQLVMVMLWSSAGNM